MKPRLVLAALAGLLAAWPARADWGDWLKKTAESMSESREKRRGERSSGVSTAGVRGLGEDEGKGDKGARDYAAVDWLDGLELEAGELARFVKEGGLAP